MRKQSSEKLQKVLANLGLASRRTIEEWIQAGRIKVNNQIAKIGMRVDLHDVIKVDNRVVRMPRHETKTRLILYHKPEGEICSREDPERRRTVFMSLPKLAQGRWIGIGRLDINTSGLLLFTNDGELANKLMHPSANLEREYAVRIYGNVDEEVLKKLQQGVILEDGKAKFEKIIDAGGEGRNHWYHVIVKEGKNRLVRRLWESQNVKISRLIRIRFGNYTLPKHLRIGKWMEIECSLDGAKRNQ